MSSSRPCPYFTEVETEVAQGVGSFAQVTDLVGGGPRIQTQGPLACLALVTTVLCAHRHTRLPTWPLFLLTKIVMWASEGLEEG